MNMEQHANLIMLIAANGRSANQIAAELGLDIEPVAKLISCHLGKTQSQPHNAIEYEPTPEEISEACREIQSTWDDIERQRRTVTCNPAAAIPRVSDPDSQATR